MPKLDPTTRYVNENQKRPDFVRTRVNANDAPPNRDSVARLTYRGFRKPLPFRFQDLANRAVNSALPNHAYFLDTCFVKKEVPQQCWDALLSKTICITPWIDYELREWRRDPRINCSFHAAYEQGRSDQDQRFVFLSPQTDDPDLASAISHYVSLLCFRKDIFRSMRDQLKADTGQQPSDDQVHREVQKLVRERGMTIATKGRDDEEKPNFTADEDLIVRAFVFALTTGRDVTVLTRDKDLSEQFFKLQYLIDTHYRSFLLANAFADQPLNFRRYDDPNSKFEMHGFESIEIYQMPAGMDDRVLPDDYQFVNVHVDRIIDSGSDLYHSAFGFSAETKMEEMLRVKGRTKGLNTEALGGKNLHRCIHPNLQKTFGNCVGVVEDRFVISESNRWSLTDVQMVLAPCERSGDSQDIEIPQSKAEQATLAQAQEIAYFKFPRRLTPTYSLEWMQTNLASVSLAIQLMEPWTRFLISDELLGDLPPKLIEALSSKDCFVLPSCEHVAPCEKMQPIPKGEGRKIIDYYTALLAHRKMFGLHCRNRLLKKMGRMPSEREIRIEMQQFSDPSCWLRAKDYLDRPGDPHVFDDEHLAVDAVFRAICNSRETIILTRRKTLVDQFWTLVATVQAHYRAWAIAKSDSKRLLDIDLETSRPFPGFQSGPVKREYPGAYVDECLPRNSLEVGVQVWCIEGNLNDRFRIYPMGFPVEPAMVEMFRCKEENDFRVADWNDSRNVYLRYGYDLDSGHESAACFIGRDGFVQIGSTDFPQDARLPLTIAKVPSFDITLMTSMDRQIPFPWAAAERSKLNRENLKKRRAKLEKGIRDK